MRKIEKFLSNYCRKIKKKTEENFSQNNVRKFSQKKVGQFLKRNLIKFSQKKVWKFSQKNIGKFLKRKLKKKVKKYWLHCVMQAHELYAGSTNDELFTCEYCTKRSL